MGPLEALKPDPHISTLDPKHLYPRGIEIPTSKAITFENYADGVVLAGWLGDLRQEETIRSGHEGFTLVARDPELTQVTGTWRVRGKDHDHVYTGSLSLEVETRDITESLRIILGLQDDFLDEASDG